AALGGPAGSRAALRIGVAGARARRADVGALRAAGVPVLVPLPVRGVAAAEAVPWWGEADLADRPSPGAARLAAAALAALHRRPLTPAARYQPPLRLLARHARAVLELAPYWAPGSASWWTSCARGRPRGRWPSACTATSRPIRSWSAPARSGSST